MENPFLSFFLFHVAIKFAIYLCRKCCSSKDEFVYFCFCYLFSFTMDFGSNQNFLILFESPWNNLCLYLIWFTQEMDVQVEDRNNLYEDNEKKRQSMAAEMKKADGSPTNGFALLPSLLHSTSTSSFVDYDFTICFVYSHLFSALRSRTIPFPLNISESCRGYEFLIVIILEPSTSLLFLLFSLWLYIFEYMICSFLFVLSNSTLLDRWFESDGLSW